LVGQQGSDSIEYGGQGGSWSSQKSGGGGVSYNTGSNPDSSSGVNAGHSDVIIEKL